MSNVLENVVFEGRIVNAGRLLRGCLQSDNKGTLVTVHG